MKEMIINTEVSGLPIESPLVYARALANLELRNDATVEERAWLANNPLLWLRVLWAMQEETNAAIGRDRINLKQEISKIFGPQDTNTAAYWAFRAGPDAREARRLHFLKLVQRRIRELKVALGPDLASATLTGEIAGDLATIADQVMSDPHEARTRLLALAEHLVRTYNLEAVPDNSDATPVGLILPYAEWPGSFRCRACRRELLTIANPTCGTCGQRHALDFQRK